MEDIGFGDDIPVFGFYDLPEIIVQGEHQTQRDVESPASAS